MAHCRLRAICDRIINFLKIFFLSKYFTLGLISVINYCYNMHNNINVVNVAIMITVSLMINYLNGKFSLLIAMSFITNYVIYMRASSIKYVVHRTFRFGVVSFFLFFSRNLTKRKKRKEFNQERTRKELYSTNIGTCL